MHRNRGSFGRNCTETMSCRWGTELWDQFDNLEKHTHWGIEFVERYTKFVKERSEIEISYAKQIRNLSKKYQPKKNSREEDEYKYTSCRAFLMTLNELNDYAGQHEVIAENLTTHIICELTRYIQELKAERKSHFHDGRRAQQHIENSWKQLESSKRRFERDCKEADRAQQYFDKIDADINVTKADVEKVSKRCSLKARQQAQLKHQVAEDSKNEYLTYLQKFNKEQNEHYYSLIPHIFQKIQEMEEKKIEKVGESMKTYAEVNRKVLPIVSKCLDGMTNAAASIEPTTDTKQVVESFKSGFEPPGDVEVEDYSLSMRRTVSESSYLNSRGEGKPSRSNSRGKLWPFKRNKGSGPEDCSHLPPEQRRKKLQAKINDINKELQKEVDQRDALTKMKDVYVKNPHMGDPNSVDSRLEEIGQNIDKLELDSRKYEAWLLEVETRLAEKSDPHRRQSGLYDSNATTPVNNNCAPVNRESPDGSYTEDHSTEHHLKSRSTDFDDDFDDEDPLPTIGTCKSLYPFEGQNEGTISMAEGELLYVIEEDKGDGWTRVRRNEDEEGYVPTSYIKVFFDTNAKGAMTYI
ncbi:formin-binding protein 1-like isoform X6 [Salvelinus fontinalis]|uniref:formin-binding protein 1-like isoform X6 n=1 Tax=Salvelinus fontinalis TaxID=8038 RepID=UPI0024855A5C|nr:formin-binding protein 1-like isoform X6 [Salvelinus fontinalis]